MVAYSGHKRAAGSWPRSDIDRIEILQCSSLSCRTEVWYPSLGSAGGAGSETASS